MWKSSCWKTSKVVRKNRWSATGVLSRSGHLVHAFKLKAIKAHCSTRDRLELGRGSCMSQGRGGMKKKKRKKSWRPPPGSQKIGVTQIHQGRPQWAVLLHKQWGTGKGFTVLPITKVSGLWSTQLHRDEIMADSQNGSTLLKRKINLICEDKRVSLVLL